ncbi:MAG: ribosome maturation factor RimM [Myxococcota bacterium]
MAEDEVVLGEIAGVFGIRGEVRLMLHHREGRTLFGGEREVTLVAPDGSRRPARLVARSGAGKRVLAKIAGVDTPEDARALMGTHLVVGRAQLPPPGEDEHYLHDLFDLPVYDDAGAELGTLADVVTGEKDVWVIETPAGEAYVVATKENVLSVRPDRIVLRAGALETGE